MASDIKKYINSFSGEYTDLMKRITAEIIKKLRTRSDVEGVVREVFTAYGVDAKLQGALFDSIVGAVKVGVSVTGATPAISSPAIKKWFSERAYSTAGVKFSDAINKLGSKKEITSTIRQSIQIGESWKTAAKRLGDKGIQTADVAGDVQQLFNIARKAAKMSDDPKILDDYKIAVQNVQKRINKLSRTDTSKLKRAYQNIVDLTEKSSEAAMENAIKYAAYFKQRYNAERIARTEISRAYGQSFFSSIAGDEFAVAWRWRLSSSHVDKDICDVHANANLYGKGPGIYPIGYGPEFPGHPHCLPGNNRVWFDGKIVGACKSFYRGEVIKISLASGKRFTITPNHPVLTSDGWVTAENITKGTDVLSCTDGQRPSLEIGFGVTTAKPYNNQRPPRVKDVFRAFKKSEFVTSIMVPPTAKDFHGDGVRVDGNINVINSDGFLLCDIESKINKIFSKGVFGGRNIRFFNLVSKRMTSFLFGCFMPSPKKIMRLFGTFFTMLRVPPVILKQGIRPAPQTSILYDKTRDKLSAFPDSVADFFDRFSGKITLDNVVNVSRRKHNSHVYDLQVEPSQIYMCNGVIVKNCMCNLEKIYYGEIEKPTADDYDPKAMEKFLNKRPESFLKTALGVAGAKEFGDDPRTWERNLRNWNGHGGITATIPKKVLMGKK